MEGIALPPDFFYKTTTAARELPVVRTSPDRTLHPAESFTYLSYQSDIGLAPYPLRPIAAIGTPERGVSFLSLRQVTHPEKKMATRMMTRNRLNQYLNQSMDVEADSIADDVVSKVAQLLRDSSNNTRWRPTMKLPSFSGAPHECPLKFLDMMEKFFKDLDGERKQQVVGGHWWMPWPGIAALRAAIQRGPAIRGGYWNGTTASTLESISTCRSEPIFRGRNRW